MKTTIKAIAFVALAGCAASPESIAPSYVSPVTYSGLSCGQLAKEAVNVDQATSRAYAQQRKARSDDTVGVILIGLPTSTLSGGNVATQVADLKGRREVLRQTMVRKNCRGV